MKKVVPVLVELLPAPPTAFMPFLTTIHTVTYKKALIPAIDKILLLKRVPTPSLVNKSEITPLTGLKA